MNPILANAENADPTEANFVAILACAGAIIAVAVMVGVVIVIARRKRLPSAELVSTAMFFWGAICLGSIVYETVVQMKWAHDHLLDLESGYGNPADVGPGWPWMLWVGLGVVYAGALGWVVMAKKSK